MVVLLPTIIPLASLSSWATPTNSCYCFPGDNCWPSARQWFQFNQTIGGRLVATVPIAAVCHSGEGTLADTQSCDRLKTNWFFPETHLPSSSSAMAPLFTNNSCSPFTPQATPCTLGNYVAYSVNASTPLDIQKTIAFASLHHIRLVIRNTGHDYNGKSTGAGALAVWTLHMKETKLIENYRAAKYSGRALKLGAGVMIHEAYKFADRSKGIVVGGNCPTVGMAGGFTQGGGHGPLASRFGLGADQVLEWSVVSATGKLTTATPKKNSDLYWALSGGGPGTYGVVVSLTVKLHPPLPISAAKMSFAKPTTVDGMAAFWKCVKRFLESIPDMVDAGVQVTWSLVPGMFIASPVTGPGVSRRDLDRLFDSTLRSLDKHQIPYQYQSHQYPTFLQNYEAMNLPGSNVSDAVIGGRLISRQVIEENIDGFLDAARMAVEMNFVFVGVSLDVSRTPSTAVSVNPYWRKTLINVAIGTFFNYQNFSVNFQNQQIMTDTLLPMLANLDGDEGGVYLNEADFMEPDWKTTFYGDNYESLDAIKRKYDPRDIFYALGAVGSDRWRQKQDGRLCKA